MTSCRQDEPLKLLEALDSHPRRARIGGKKTEAANKAAGIGGKETETANKEAGIGGKETKAANKEVEKLQTGTQKRNRYPTS